MIYIVSPYRMNRIYNHAFDLLGKKLFPVLRKELDVNFIYCEEIKCKRKFHTIRKIGKVVVTIISGRPNLVANHWPLKKRREFRRILKSDGISFVHFEYLQSTYINRAIKKISFTYTMHDSIRKNNPYFSNRKKSKRLYFWIQYILLVKHEVKIIGHAKKTFVFNNEDYKYVLEKNGNPVLVEIGIEDPERNWNLDNLQKIEVVFAGALWRSENEDICNYIIDSVLPNVRKDFPSIRFILLGSNPSKNLSDRVGMTSGIEIRSDVKDFAYEISNSSISLCLSKVYPGISLKFLLSLKMGIPTIANSNVAYSLPGRKEQAKMFILADSLDEICKGIRDILENREFSLRMVRNAEQFMSQHYTLEGYFHRYICTFREILSIRETS